MQKCDAVLASGQNVESFAIPALQPLVVYLFMTSSGKPSGELLTQREVHQSVFLFSIVRVYHEWVKYFSACVIRVCLCV